MFITYRVLNYAGYESAHEQAFAAIKKPVSAGSLGQTNVADRSSLLLKRPLNFAYAFVDKS